MNKTQIIIEVGMNHMGNIHKAKKYFNFFLKSEYKKITFQINTPQYYKKKPYILKRSFYENILKLAKKNNKQVGLAVCDINTFKPLSNLKFDFYKLLSISINDKKLIDLLKKTKKEVYISLGIADNYKIKKCLKQFGKKNRLRLVYTNFSYDAKDLNLKTITNLKHLYNLKVGYGHHYNNLIPIILSKALDYDFIFLYIKSKKINKSDKNLPDDLHAVDINDLNKINLKLEEVSKMLKNDKINKKIKIFG